MRQRAIGSVIGGFDVPVAAQICLVVVLASLVIAAVIFAVSVVVHRRGGERSAK